MVVDSFVHIYFREALDVRITSRYGSSYVNPNIVRDRMLTIRLRAHEHLLIGRAAAVAITKISEWARETLLTAAEDELREEELRPKARTKRKGA